MSDGGDTGARELGLVIIFLGCLLTVFVSTFGAVWAFYGIGWACVSGIALSVLMLVLVLNMLFTMDKS